MSAKLWLAVSLVFAGATLVSTALNRPPVTPRITEPPDDGAVLSPADVHMETAPFSDPDGNAHRCTDWEIWTMTPLERAAGDLVYRWAGAGPHASRRRHVRELSRRSIRPHAEDELPAAGQAPGQQRRRGDRVERVERTLLQHGGGTHRYHCALDTPAVGLSVGRRGIGLPVARQHRVRASPGLNGVQPVLYVTELYGAIKVVTRDFTVRTYASGLLNFNPTGTFPGSGEQGVTGIVVSRQR